MQCDPNGLIDKLVKHPRIKGRESPFGMVAGWTKDARVDEGEDKNDLISVINTPRVDLEKEVVVPSGATGGYLHANGKIFADHNYSIMDCVGFLRNGLIAYPSKSEQVGWRARVGLYTENTLSNAVKMIVQQSGKIGMSIGFIPTDRGAPTSEEVEKYGEGFRSIVRACDIFEVSYTCLPCNVDCQTKEVSFDYSGVDDIEQLVTRGKIDRVSASKLGVPGVTPERKFHATRTEKSIHISGFGTVRSVG